MRHEEARGDRQERDCALTQGDRRQLKGFFLMVHVEPHDEGRGVRARRPLNANKSIERQPPRSPEARVRNRSRNALNEAPAPPTGKNAKNPDTSSGATRRRAHGQQPRKQVAKKAGSLNGLAVFPLKESELNRERNRGRGSPGPALSPG